MESTTGCDRDIPNLSAAYVNHGVTEPTPDDNHEAIVLEPIGGYQSKHTDYDVPRPYESIKRAGKRPSRCSTKTTVFVVIIVLIIILAAVGFVGYHFTNESNDKSNPPVISNCPQDITRQLPTNQTLARVTWDEPTATDDETPARQLTQTQNHSPGQEFAIGITSVIYTFTDDGGKTSVCNFNIILTARVPLALTCPSDVSVTTSGLSTTKVAFKKPTVSGGTAPYDTTSNPSSGSFFTTKTTTVTCTSTNDLNGITTCTFTVDVVSLSTPNITPPEINNCPNNFTISTNPGETAAIATWDEPATDDSGTVNTDSTHTPPTSFGLGPNTVVYIFSDPAGNEAPCMSVVTVLRADGNDSTPPVIANCPSDITTPTVMWTPPTATDDVTPPDQITRFVTLTSTPDHSFPVGTTTVIYLFTDLAGNRASCSFNFIGWDSPCPENQTRCDSGKCVLSSKFCDGFSDCPDRSDELMCCPETQFNCANGRCIELDTLCDDNNDCRDNSDEDDCADESDTTPPVIVNCPSDITTPSDSGQTIATVTWTLPTATDDVTPPDQITRVSTQTQGQPFSVGTTTVTYIFTDRAGNDAICTFDVILWRDIVVSNCPNDTIVEANPDENSIQVKWDEPSAVDSSGVDVEANSKHPPRNFNIPSTNKITYEFRTDSGGYAVCVFTITIRNPE